MNPVMVDLGVIKIYDNYSTVDILNKKYYELYH